MSDPERSYNLGAIQIYRSKKHMMINDLYLIPHRATVSQVYFRIMDNPEYKDSIVKVVLILINLLLPKASRLHTQSDGLVLRFSRQALGI